MLNKYSAFCYVSVAGKPNLITWMHLQSLLHPCYSTVFRLFCFVEFIGNFTTYTKLNKQTYEKEKKARLSKGRGKSGTRGHMQGTLPDISKSLVLSLSMFVPMSKSKSVPKLVSMSA